MDIFDGTELFESSDDDSDDEDDKKPEENQEIERKIDPDTVLEAEFKSMLSKKALKNPFIKCARCDKELNSADKWFYYGVRRIYFGHTMVHEPLCKSCFHDFEAFMNELRLKC